MNVQYMPFSPSVAKDVGLNEAIMVAAILHDAANGKKSASQWREMMPWWSESTIKRSLNRLKQKNLLSEDGILNVQASEPIAMPNAAIQSSPEKCDEYFANKGALPWMASRRRNDYDREFLQYLQTVYMPSTKYWSSDGRIPTIADAKNYISSRLISQDGLASLESRWESFCVWKQKQEKKQEQKYTVVEPSEPTAINIYRRRK